MLPKINVIGYGNLAVSLVQMLQNNTEVSLQSVYSSKPILAEEVKPFYVSKIENLQISDITFITVKDDAIAEVSTKIPYQNSLIVHCSGAKNIELLKNFNRRGVFYPLQSFSKTHKVDFLNIPLCLEANTSTDLNLLKKIAKQCSTHIYTIHSDQRKYIHLIAVFVNNFTNHLVQLGNEIADDKNIPFELFIPLLRKTFNKLETMPAKEAQTGPAIRNDKETIAKHLELITDEKTKEIYQLISESIIKNGKKL